MYSIAMVKVMSQGRRSVMYQPVLLLWGFSCVAHLYGWEFYGANHNRLGCILDTAMQLQYAETSAGPFKKSITSK